jgi:hypothetical protein
MMDTKQREARTSVCSFRLTPTLRKRVEARLRSINNSRKDGDPAYGVADFFAAATLALLTDDVAECHEWLEDARK